MNRFISVVSFISIIAGLSSGCGRSGEEAGAAAVKKTGEPGYLNAVEESFDFGQVARGTVVKHEFTLRNEGGTPVRVTEVKAGCSCTAAVVSTPVVEPGQDARIEVSFSTKGRRGFQSKSVKVMTDSTLKPDLTLTVSGRIEPAVTFEPENLELGVVAKGSKVVREIDLKGIRSEGVSIAGLTVSPPEDPRLSAMVIEGTGGRRIQVTFNSEGQDGVFRGRIDAALNGGDEKSIFMNVYAEVSGDVRVEPAIVRFPPPGELVKAGQTTQSAIITVKSLSGRPFRVKGIRPVDPKSPALVRLVQTIPVEGGFQLTLEGPLSKEPVTGDLELLTDRKGEDPVRFGFTAGIREPAKTPSSFKGRRLDPGSDQMRMSGVKVLRGMKDSLRDEMKRAAGGVRKQPAEKGTPK